MAGPAKILVVDDDPDVREVVSRSLPAPDFETTVLEGGGRVLDVVETEGIELVVLDLGLPDADGLMLTRALKERFDVGIIILSGQSEPTEKIVGLEIGADDYVAKPFVPRELRARVKSVLRRTTRKMATASAAPVAARDVYVFDGWRVDVSARALATPDGAEIDLTSGEFDLLRAFVEHPNRVLSRDQLLELVHSNDAPAFDRSIDVKIGRLRKKIETDPGKPKYVKTMRNAGYMFTGSVTKA